jgi:hypothetical protein
MINPNIGSNLRIPTLKVGSQQSAVGSWQPAFFSIITAEKQTP